MVKENKLHAAVRANNVGGVLRVLQKYSKSKARSNSSKSKKIDFELRDNLGLTAIHHAARNGAMDVLETLLVHESPFDIFDSHGLRPIGYACAEGHLKIVEYLLRWGSCPNRISNVEYLTPLHLSAMYGYVEIVHLLLRYKADPFVVNRDNKTPLDLACAYGKYNVINLLFSFTSSTLSSKTKQPANGASFNDCYSPRTPQSDQIARCNRFNQSNMPSTPKVERYTSRRSSSPYGSTNSSSGGSCNYNTNSSKNKVVRNMSFVETGCNGGALCHGDMRHSLRSGTLCNNNQQQQEVTEVAGVPASTISNNNNTICVPPTLEATSTPDIPTDLRQNLREACFAVQAKALMTFQATQDNNSRTISFEAGDLITVLKQYHNGVMKGFVTSEGISSTGLFPAQFVEFINDHSAPTCCDKPMEITANVYQSPEKTPIPNRGRGAKERPSYLDLSDTMHHQKPPCESENDDGADGSADEDEGGGSPIIIPPQMTNIRTCTTTSAVNWSSSGLPRCNCDRHHTHQHQQKVPSNGCIKRSVVGTLQSPELPSVSISDLSYCLSLGGQGLISAVSGSLNKRNSIVSMDSGRGSATDSKSVVSGSTPASSVNCGKPPSSPMHCCPQPKAPSDLDCVSSTSSSSSQCLHCRACPNLPPTVPAPPYHHHLQSEGSSTSSPFRCSPGPDMVDLVFPNPRTSGAYSQQQVSIDSLYYPCSMISLDDTQYSSGSSDRGSVDDVMVNWLHSVGLGSYSDILSNAGYDLATLTKATPEDLNASGITNPKDRQFMKTQLNRLSVYDGLPETMPPTVHDFLDGLKLLQYEQLLSKQNFTKIDHLLGLTWEDLADIGIQKLGHQKKLSLAMERLSRLVQCNHSLSTSHNQISPPTQSRMDQDPSGSKLACVPQSRSFEELPYPAAIMADQDQPRRGDVFPRSRYRGLRFLSYKGSPMVGHCGGGGALLSKSDESVSSVTEIPLPGYTRHDDLSVSSSASSCCSQDSSSHDGSRPTHNTLPSSSASHFAHDNMGTVRIKRPMMPLLSSQDCTATDPS